MSFGVSLKPVLAPLTPSIGSEKYEWCLPQGAALDDLTIGELKKDFEHDVNEVIWWPTPVPCTWASPADGVCKDRRSSRPHVLPAA